MGQSATGDVKLTLTAVTDNFRSEMKESTKSLRDWNQGVNSIAQSAYSVQNFSKSVNEAIAGISSGNLSQAISGLANSFKDASIAIPSVTTSLKSVGSIISALAPMAASLGALGLAVGAITAAVYMGMEAWKSYQSQAENLRSAFDALDKATLGPLNATIDETKKAIENLKFNAATAGMDTHAASLFKANQQYEEMAQKLFGLMEMEKLQIELVRAASDATVEAEGMALENIEKQMTAAREAMKLTREKIQLIENENAAIKRQDAIEKARAERKAYAREMSSWSGAQTPMTVWTGEGIEQQASKTFGESTPTLDTDAMRNARLASSVGAMAGEAFDETRTKLDGLGSALVDELGDTTVLGDAFNMASDAFGPQLVSDAVDLGSTLGNAMSKAGGMAKSAGMALMGNPLVQGFLELAMRTRSFKEIMNIVNNAMDSLVPLLEPIVNAVKPIVNFLAVLLGILGPALVPIFEALEPILIALFYVIKGVTLAIFYIVKGLGDAWNGILSGIAKIFRKLGDIEILGGKPLAFMDDWAKTIEKGKIKMTDLNSAIDKLESATLESGYQAGVEVGMDAGAAEVFTRSADGAYEIDRTTDAMTELADATEEATESLTNVPQGYKVALSRFNAMDTFSASTAGAYSTQQGGITINHAEIKADNPLDLWRKLQEIGAWENFASNGTPIPVAAPYLGK